MRSFSTNGYDICSWFGEFKLQRCPTISFGQCHWPGTQSDDRQARYCGRGLLRQGMACRVNGVGQRVCQRERFASQSSHTKSRVTGWRNNLRGYRHFSCYWIQIWLPQDPWFEWDENCSWDLALPITCNGDWVLSWQQVHGSTLQIRQDRHNQQRTTWRIPSCKEYRLWTSKLKLLQFEFLCW